MTLREKKVLMVKHMETVAKQTLSTAQGSSSGSLLAV